MLIGLAVFLATVSQCFFFVNNVCMKQVYWGVYLIVGMFCTNSMMYAMHDVCCVVDNILYLHIFGQWNNSKIDSKLISLAEELCIDSFLIYMRWGYFYFAMKESCRLVLYIVHYIMECVGKTLLRMFILYMREMISPPPWASEYLPIHLHAFHLISRSIKGMI